MSGFQTHAQAIGASPIHPEAAARLARALTAIAAEFDTVMGEEIDRLRHYCALVEEDGAAPAARADLRAAAEAVHRDGRLLGHPLIAEIAGSLITILDAWPATAVPLDVVDAHIETMTTVLTNPRLDPASAAQLVADLAAAAADYVTRAPEAA